MAVAGDMRNLFSRDADDQKRSRLDSKSKNEAGIDRLSPLPDSVLLHIFSFLPMEEVVRTCILSKQWKAIWTSASTLRFRHQLRSDDDFHLRKFVSFVDKTLILIDGSKIKKFELDFEYRRCLYSDVSTWIKFAANSGAEEMELNFRKNSRDRFVLPRSMYDNKDLTKLSMSMCSHLPNEGINWKSLKILKIERTCLTGCNIQTLISGSPLLEFLELRKCYGFDKLVISNSNLRRLVIDEIQGQTNLNSVLEITAPSVLSLEILGDWGHKKIHLLDIRSCVNAKLDFQLSTVYDKEQLHTHILTGLRHVQELSLGAWCIEALSAVEENDFHFPVTNWKCLKLHAPAGERYMDAILSLLQISHDVETFVINMVEPKLLIKMPYGEDVTYSTPKSRFFFPRLKTVEAFNLESMPYDSKIMFTQLLLQYSPLLEKIVIFRRSNEEQEGCNLYKQLEMAQHLSNYPKKSSKKAVIVFKN